MVDTLASLIIVIHSVDSNDQGWGKRGENTLLARL